MQVGRQQRELNKRWCAVHVVNGSGQRNGINPIYAVQTSLARFIYKYTRTQLLCQMFWLVLINKTTVFAVGVIRSTLLQSRSCVTEACDVALSPGRTGAAGTKGGLRSRHLAGPASEFGPLCFTGPFAIPVYFWIMYISLIPSVKFTSESAFCAVLLDVNMILFHFSQHLIHSPFEARQL